MTANQGARGLEAVFNSPEGKKTKTADKQATAAPSRDKHRRRREVGNETAATGKVRPQTRKSTACSGQNVEESYQTGRMEWKF